LRAPLRISANNANDCNLDAAIDGKPKGHDFVIDRRNRRAAVNRHMSVTGG
jgi:cyclic pyranopterin phosphate synthase